MLHLTLLTFIELAEDGEKGSSRMPFISLLDVGATTSEFHYGNRRVTMCHSVPYMDLGLEKQYDASNV